MPFRIANQPLLNPTDRSLCFVKMVSPSYFGTLRLRLRRGRVLGERDRQGGSYVTVINETMARKYFPNLDPVGQHVIVQEIVPFTARFGPEISWEVVGVIADERVTTLGDTRESPGMYVSNEQSPTPFQSLIVRTTVSPAQLGESLRKAVYRVDPSQAVAEIKTLDQFKAESMASDEFRLWLLGVFAAIALLLAAVGIYGVIAYSVVRQTHELGIRGALGAGVGHLLGLIVRDGMFMTAAGLALGLAGALGAKRVLTAFLFGVGGSDAIAFLAAGGTLASVAALACYLPARRATKVDPLVAIRCE